MKIFAMHERAWVQAALLALISGGDRRGPLRLSRAGAGSSTLEVAGADSRNGHRERPRQRRSPSRHAK